MRDVNPTVRSIGLARLPADLMRALEEAAGNLVAAATVLERLTENRAPALLEALEGHELAGDRITHDLLQQLRRARLSAVERGNLVDLARAIDDAVDALEDAGHQTAKCDCGDAAHALAGVLRDAVREEAALVRAIVRGETPPLLDRLRELQQEARRRMRRALAETLDGGDPIEALRREHCLEHLGHGMSAGRRIKLAAERVALDA